jgi:hypothetical protein
MTNTNIKHDAESLRQALANTLEDPRLNVYWLNVLTGAKTRIVNARQNRSQLQVKQVDGWYSVDDPRDVFSIE